MDFVFKFFKIFGWFKTYCSRGRFITFLDADDLWHRDFLNESINFRNKFNYPVPITHTSYIRFSEKTENINLFEINPPKKINYKNILRKKTMWSSRMSHSPFATDCAVHISHLLPQANDNIMQCLVN